MPSDLIFREDVKDYARHAIAKGLNVLEYLDEVPAANFRPVVQGEWTLFGRRGIYGVMYECSASRNKAKALALATDACEDAQYIDIEVHRMPELDCEYRGHFEMEWDDPQDRAALIAHGWACFEVEPDECQYCAGSSICESYADYLRDVAICEQYEKEAQAE